MLTYISFVFSPSRNPWGERSYNGVGEWNGPWSDGSKEWTPYWLKKLNHTFGDDGVFWMSFQDMLETFLFLHRTRLFDEKWTVVQQWSSVNVAWVSGYLNTKFVVEVKKGGMVVIALTQVCLSVSSSPVPQTCFYTAVFFHVDMHT